MRYATIVMGEVRLKISDIRERMDGITMDGTITPNKKSEPKIMEICLKSSN